MAKEWFLLVFFFSPSIYVGVEAVRLVEPVVEELKVKLMANANKMMADARIKGMKAMASLAGHQLCSVGRRQSRWATYCLGK